MKRYPEHRKRTSHTWPHSFVEFSCYYSYVESDVKKNCLQAYRAYLWIIKVFPSNITPVHTDIYHKIQDL